MKLKRAFLFLLFALILASCGDGKGFPVENAFLYDHVNGHKEITPTLAFVLFEYEQLAYVKYQIAYIACTCRSPEVNYYSVAYVELSKEDGSLQFISYEKDSEGHYTAGLYGDSDESWDGTPVRQLYDQFIEENLMGQSQDSINSIQAMHGKVDTYTGATVTPNNGVKMLQGLFEYLNKKYMNS